jgi:multidrug efflux system outer membrane protein
MFPTISLTGILGIATRALSDATSQDAVFWAAGGGVLAPIFYGGRLRKNYQATLARNDAAAALYLKAAMNAFRETADALVDVQKSREIRAAAERGVAELREASRLALIRYDGGLSSYLEVLDADRQLFAAENQLARVLGFQVNTYVNLYRALGGGWNADALEQQADSTGT